MDDAVRRYTKAAIRMGFARDVILKVDVIDSRRRGQDGRWVYGMGSVKFWVPHAYALMESPGLKQSALRHSICTRCGLDIEGLGDGNWRDRGNDTHCPNSGLLHRE